LAHTVVHVVTGQVGVGQRLAALPQGQVGTGQVGGAAQQFRQQRAVGVQGVLAGLAAGDGLGLFRHFTDVGRCLGCEVGGQLAGHAALEFGGQFRVLGGVGGEALVPFGLAGGASSLGVPLGVDLVGNFERAMVPAQRGASGGDFVMAQRRAVALFLAGLVRRTEADGGLAADQGRLGGVLAGGLDGLDDLVAVMAVDVADYLPAVGLEALRG